MKTNSYAAHLTWVMNAVARGRYPSGGLPFALATRLLLDTDLHAVASARSDARVAGLLKSMLARVAGDDSDLVLSSSRARAVVASARQFLASGPSPSRPALALPAVARRGLVTLLSFFSSIPYGRRGIARHALTVILTQQLRDAELGHDWSICSARWLAEKLGGVAVGTAHRALIDLIEAGVLREKRLRAGGTRAVKIRATKEGRGDVVLGWLFMDDLAALAEGAVEPPVGSLADLVAASGSPMWHAAGVPAAAWPVALADTVRPRLAEFVSKSRGVARGLRRQVAHGRATAEQVERVEALIQVGVDLQRRTKEYGGPRRTATAREWLAGRPDDVSYVAWLSELAKETGAAAAAEKRASQMRAEQRERRRAADQATGRRSWTTPEEWAATVLKSAGATPGDKTAAGDWLARVAGAYRGRQEEWTPARRDAMTLLVERVLTRRTGLSEAVGARAARQVVEGGSSEREAA